MVAAAARPVRCRLLGCCSKRETRVFPCGGCFSFCGERAPRRVIKSGGTCTLPLRSRREHVNTCAGDLLWQRQRRTEREREQLPARDAHGYVTCNEAFLVKGPPLATSERERRVRLDNRQ